MKWLIRIPIYLASVCFALAGLRLAQAGGLLTLAQQIPADFFDPLVSMLLLGLGSAIFAGAIGFSSLFGDVF